MALEPAATGGMNLGGDIQWERALDEMRRQLELERVELERLESEGRQMQAEVTEALADAKSKGWTANSLAAAPFPSVSQADELTKSHTPEVASILPAAIDAMRGLVSKPPALHQTEREWHYALDDRSVGPVAQSTLLDLLRNGKLTWETLVWNETQPDWIPAHASELARLTKRLPPPLPSAKVSQIHSIKARICKTCGQEQSEGNRFCAGCGAQLS
jgi:hypothetical protein